MAILHRTYRKSTVRPLMAAAGLIIMAGSASASAMPQEPISVLSNLKIQLYGYIKADMSSDSTGMSNGEFARWVHPGDLDGEFNITARQTRLGFKVEGPEANGIKTSGRVEVDFYGGGAQDSAALRMRHAYVNLDWVGKDMSVLAGQTSDVISPLTTPTINYTVLWWSGDMGFRNNQVRFTKGFGVGENSRLQIQAAIVRSETGESEGPGFQGRLAYTFPGMSSKATTVGVYAHSSEEISGATTVDSNSVGFDLVLPINDAVSIKAEYWMGENMDEFLGGIGQGTNAADEEIESEGWWASVTYKATAKTTCNFGYGMDSPEEDDLDAGMRSENSTLFGNVNYSLNSATVVGLEIAEHTTDYVGLSDEDGLRIQLALTMKF